MEIVKKYHFNGKVYDSYEEAEIEAQKFDDKYVIKDILSRYLWNLCYDVDTKWETTMECRNDPDCAYAVDVALSSIMRELQYEENKEKLKGFLYENPSN